MWLGESFLISGSMVPRNAAKKGRVHVFFEITLERRSDASICILVTQTDKPADVFLMNRAIFSDACLIT